MLLRMPTDFLIIRTAKRGTILLNYAMVKSQIHEIAALLKEKSGKVKLPSRGDCGPE